MLKGEQHRVDTCRARNTKSTHAVCSTRGRHLQGTHNTGSTPTGDATRDRHLQGTHNIKSTPVGHVKHKTDTCRVRASTQSRYLQDSRNTESTHAVYSQRRVGIFRRSQRRGLTHAHTGTESLAQTKTQKDNKQHI